MNVVEYYITRQIPPQSMLFYFKLIKNAGPNIENNIDPVKQAAIEMGRKQAIGISENIKNTHYKLGPNNFVLII